MPNVGFLNDDEFFRLYFMVDKETQGKTPLLYWIDDGVLISDFVSDDFEDKSKDVHFRFFSNGICYSVELAPLYDASDVMHDVPASKEEVLKHHANVKSVFSFMKGSCKGVSNMFLVDSIS